LHVFKIDFEKQEHFEQVVAWKSWQRISIIQCYWLFQIMFMEAVHFTN